MSIDKETKDEIIKEFRRIIRVNNKLAESLKECVSLLRQYKCEEVGNGVIYKAEQALSKAQEEVK